MPLGPILFSLLHFLVMYCTTYEQAQASQTTHQPNTTIYVRLNMLLQYHTYSIIIPMPSLFPYDRAQGEYGVLFTPWPPPPQQAQHAKTENSSYLDFLPLPTAPPLSDEQPSSEKHFEGHITEAAERYSKIPRMTSGI